MQTLNAGTSGLAPKKKTSKIFNNTFVILNFIRQNAQTEWPGPWVLWNLLLSMNLNYQMSFKMVHFSIKNKSHTCQLFLFWRNSSSFRSKKENDFIMCSCFCSNLCIAMYRKFRNVPLFKFFSLICSSFWKLKVGKYEILEFVNLKCVAYAQPITLTLTYYPR